MFWDTTQLVSEEEGTSASELNPPVLSYSCSSLTSDDPMQEEAIEQAVMYINSTTRKVEGENDDTPFCNNFNDNDTSNNQMNPLMAMGRCPSLENDVIATTDTVVAPRGTKSNTTAYNTTDVNSGTEKKRKRRSCLIESEIIDHLIGEGFTLGLANSMVKNSELFSLRIWVLDNSGSMAKTDGHRIVQSKSFPHKVNTIQSSRWEEVASCVIWHAQLAAVLHSPIVFRLLNDPGTAVGSQQLSVAERCYKEYTEDENKCNEENYYLTQQQHQQAQAQILKEEVKQVKRMMHQSRPLGSSPLSEHLRDIYRSLLSTQNRILANGKLIALIIATDGLPTDEEGNEHESANRHFCDALQLFQSLPVVIIVRLSTDEDRVVNFYNELDVVLSTRGCCPMNIDVLDDYIGEAREVHEHNPWLNYALPLHLSRESALRHDLLNVLDDRHLQPSELRDVCQLIFGTSRFNGDFVPDPVIDYPAFAKALKSVVDCEKYQWNPIKKKPTPWIDFKELDRIYGHNTGREAGSSCCIIL